MSSDCTIPIAVRIITIATTTTSSRMVKPAERRAFEGKAGVGGRARASLGIGPPAGADFRVWSMVYNPTRVRNKITHRRILRQVGGAQGGRFGYLVVDVCAEQRYARASLGMSRGPFVLSTCDAPLQLRAQNVGIALHRAVLAGPSSRYAVGSAHPVRVEGTIGAASSAQWSDPKLYRTPFHHRLNHQVRAPTGLKLNPSVRKQTRWLATPDLA